MISRISSFEGDALLSVLYVLCVQLILLICLACYAGWFLSVALAVVVLPVNFWVISRLFRRINASFERLTLQLEAITENDFSLTAKAFYNRGRVATAHKQLNRLTEQLRNQKSVFDQQMFLVYRLIDQLNTPILVFNHRLQLTSANAAFTDLYGQPWQTMHYATPERLQLSDQPSWRFNEDKKNEEWQIRQSHFVENGKRYQLLVFINIQSALRETQLNAWKNLIRVMSHEIKNSLTPVSALSEGLRSKEQNPRNQQALEVISERCVHLQTFVDRFSQLQKHIDCQMQWVSLDGICQHLETLYPDIELTAKNIKSPVWADPVLLEQVLINLVKNSVEACATDTELQSKVIIRIELKQQSDRTTLLIEDNGPGITNTDNIFVPFYSTKADGQGIGLALSRHLVEQMGGQLSLENKKSSRGVSACLLLPQSEEKK